MSESRTEPLPCPFCGHVGLQFDSENGSTFRWMAYSCAGCGMGTEERIQTLDMDREPAVEAAKERAVLEWNKRVPTASGLSADARSNDTTTGGLKERPEPALTDEQIDKIANSVSEEMHSEWHPHDEREWRLTFARAIVRAALSHRSTEEPADPAGARDRHVAAAAALLGPGYTLKGG